MKHPVSMPYVPLAAINWVKYCVSIPKRLNMNLVFLHAIVNNVTTKMIN